MQLQASRQFKIAVSKSCCPVCWDIVNIFNEQAKTTQEPKPLVCFRARGRHANLYPVDLPDLLDEGIKDELLTKFSITLLKDLVSLFEEDARAAHARAAHARAAHAKHLRSGSSVSQPESVALSLGSSMDSSIDEVSQDNRATVMEKFEKLKYDVHSWKLGLGDVTVSKV